MTVFNPQMSSSAAFSILAMTPLSELMALAERATIGHHGGIVNYSRKVFIPLTRLCRDPLEIQHGPQSLNEPLETYLSRLKAAGLSTLPGTAAEILDDDVRAIICPDKVTARELLDVMRTAHEVGLQSTATIMFGHVDGYEHWARHLLAIRDLQEETGGFTEFVPLPFVHMEAPIWRSGKARSGPSFREALLMHAITRLALHPLIPNIQASWVKMGREGVASALRAGVNDLGGTLMDESITHAAEGQHGQPRGIEEMTTIAACAGRPLRQRTTTYGVVPASQFQMAGS